MNRSVWSKVGVCAAVSALLALSGASAMAAEDEPSDSLSLKIASAMKPSRFFMRAGVIYVKVKTKSGATYDVTGPVATLDELRNVFTDPATLRAITIPSGVSTTAALVGASLRNVIRGVPLLTNYMADPAGDGTGIDSNGVDRDVDVIGSLGTPPGIKGKASESMGTVGISLGYYLDDNQNWLAETYVLAAPLSSSVTATTGSVIVEDPDTGELSSRPMLINGQKIVKTKLLPPTAMFGRYWGDKTSRFRLYTGLMATYAIFFDTKGTDYLNTYQGGTNPGDTSVSIKNAFGLGPMLGFKYQISEKWHASMNVGHVKLATEATITTRNSTFGLDTLALQDLGRVTTILNTAETTYSTPASNGITASVKQAIAANGGVAALVTKAVLAGRNPGVAVEDLDATYVRKTKVDLTNTLFFLSVGRDF